MALTLIATAGAVNANSYATLAEAAAFLETNPHAFPAWSNADDAEVKIPALIWATRILDEDYDWVGAKVSSTQALRWPRADVVDRDGWSVDSTTIPSFLKNATAELARHLAASDRFATRDGAQSGVQAVTAGSVSVTFDKYDRIAVLPESVLAMVGFYTTGSATGGIEVPLVRV